MLLLASTAWPADDCGDPISVLPPLKGDTVLYDAEIKFGYRGKTGVYMFPPSRCGVYLDDRNNFDNPCQDDELRAAPALGDVLVKPLDDVGTGAAGTDTTTGSVRQRGQEAPKPGESVCVMYDFQPGKTFCGAYVILMGDLTPYRTLSFWIKGDKGGETFELAMNDVISNKREDAVVIGSIHRYLREGVTTNWQEVRIPVEDFYGPSLDKVYSLVFMFNELGSGKFWVDQFRFHKTLLVDREAAIARRGFLLLDDFDHSDVNLFGRKAGTYKKLPSVCRASRVEAPRVGDRGRALKLDFRTEATGWCGYYTLLNQVDGAYYDLGRFDRVSFMVRGETGAENFELGLADRNWMNIGDSLKAGDVGRYLPAGKITTEWQRAVVPLEAFGLLDLSEMGSFVINFHEKSRGVVYVDDLKFHLAGRGIEEDVP